MIGGVCVLVLGTLDPGHGSQPAALARGLLADDVHGHDSDAGLQSAIRPASVVQPVVGDGGRPGHERRATCSCKWAGLATAILLLRHVRTRTHLVQVAAGAGLAYLAMTVATGLLTGQTWQLIAHRRRCATSLWGTLAGLSAHRHACRSSSAASASSPTSASWNWPTARIRCLQELVKRAPGTYTHSITVATLAEAAAEAIGANPLLVRVGSYFHDIGKMLKPHYFIENQAGENRHDELEPALSTLVIIGHVKDGIALAQQYGLPRPIVDFIAQHHGTTLVEYFYREAMRLQEAKGTGHDDLEACFRYPGPKPQNRENGILMLADAVESTSRSLANPTPAASTSLSTTCS